MWLLLPTIIITTTITIIIIIIIIIIPAEAARLWPRRSLARDKAICNISCRRWSSGRERRLEWSVYRRPLGTREWDFSDLFGLSDSGFFGPNPWNILAPPSNYLSKNDFRATQPLEQILDSEFLLCKLGVQPLGTWEWDSRPIMSLVANAALGPYGTSA